MRKRITTALFGGKKTPEVEKEPPAEYIIAHIHGGQSVLEQKDSVWVYSDGIFADHHDPAGTTTFYPWSGIAWIRCFNVKR